MPKSLSLPHFLVLCIPLFIQQVIYPTEQNDPITLCHKTHARVLHEWAQEIQNKKIIPNELIDLILKYAKPLAWKKMNKTWHPPIKNPVISVCAFKDQLAIITYRHLYISNEQGIQAQFRLPDSYHSLTINAGIVSNTREICLGTIDSIYIGLPPSISNQSPKWEQRCKINSHNTLFSSLQVHHSGNYVIVVNPKGEFIQFMTRQNHRPNRGKVLARMPNYTWNDEKVEVVLNSENHTAYYIRHIKGKNFQSVPYPKKIGYVNIHNKTHGTFAQENTQEGTYHTLATTTDTLLAGFSNNSHNKHGIKKFNLKNNKITTIPTKHRTPINQIMTSQDNKNILSVSMDGAYLYQELDNGSIICAKELTKEAKTLQGCHATFFSTPTLGLALFINGTLFQKS